VSDASSTAELKQQLVANQQAIDLLNEQLGRRTNEIRIIQSISAEILNTLDLDVLFANVMRLLHEVFGFEHCMILLADAAQPVVRVAASYGYDGKGIGASVPVGVGVIGMVAQRRRIMRMMGLRSRRLYAETANARTTAAPNPLPGLPNADSQLAIPLLVKDKLVGVYSVESERVNAFNALDEVILTIVSNQIAAAIDNAAAYRDLRRLAEANSRFVPREFLHLLGKDSITDTQLADRTEGTMTVLFSDIRDFTPLCESMTPAETFAFINEYLGVMAPVIRQHGGFIDKYIGDAIMAIFPQADGAVEAGLAMQERLESFNARRVERGREPIGIGIGVHTGQLIAGIIGFEDRMEGTVLGDCVNAAARLESLTKELGRALVASEQVVESLSRREAYVVDALGEVKVKGKRQALHVFGLSRARSV
jgi:adenylate cyclase